MRLQFRQHPIRVTVVFGLLVIALPAWANIVLTLPNDFIEKYKNRATITTDFVIHFTHSSPKKPSPSKPSNDGDIHISGVPDELPMPTVAELMNAASQPRALKFANQMKGTGQKVSITGVWRFWPEHGGDDRFSKGMEIDIPHTNPDHVFEIHPTTEIGSIETLTSFFPIPGFRPREATDAFQRYENIRARITPSAASTSIRMGSVGFNYVKFRIRLVFVKETKPEAAVRNLHNGDCMLVLGMPRLSLSLLAWRTSPEATDPWNMPYEMGRIQF